MPATLSMDLCVCTAIQTVNHGRGICAAIQTISHRLRCMSGMYIQTVKHGLRCMSGMSTSKQSSMDLDVCLVCMYIQAVKHGHVLNIVSAEL